MFKFDVDKLRECLLYPSDYFKKYGKATETPDGLLIYKNRGAKVLGVAHLDCVNNSKTFTVTYNKDGEIAVIHAPQLDDRLGVYILLHVLPRLGVKFDLLLTEGEEIGMSTAAYFDPPRQYNWIFSFDREGDDVVMYQYETRSNVALLARYGFTIGVGSFSDISFLEHLGVVGFNFGTGYYHRHSPKAFAVADTIKKQVSKFVRFYKDNHDTLIAYTPSKRAYSPWHLWRGAYDYHDRDIYVYDAEKDQWVERSTLDDWGFKAYDNLICDSCGINPASVYTFDGAYLCHECADTLTVVCDKCGYIYLWESIEVEYGDDGREHYFCPSCVPPSCDICDARPANNVMDNNRLCDACVATLCEKCAVCGQYYLAGQYAEHEKSRSHKDRIGKLVINRQKGGDDDKTIER